MRRFVLCLAFGLGLGGCPVTSDVLCASGACDQAGGDGGAQVPIDSCIENPTAAECLTEEASVFVDASRANPTGAPGTRSSPYGTIGEALAKLSTKKRIYVCEGTYAENVVLRSPAHDGVSLFGGVDCRWNPKDVKPVVGASSSPFVVNAAKSVAIANVAIEASDSQDGSSIALLAVGATMEIRRARLVAGNAGNGIPGALTLVSFPDPLTTLAGTSAAANVTVGGAAKSYSECSGNPGVVSTGGKGGDANGVGSPGLPSYASPGGQGGANTPAGCDASTRGGLGANGPDGEQGEGAKAFGDFVQGAWVPGAGANGANGRIGQGGGGGGAPGAFGAGGGGVGGCGGAGATGGGGGGGSVALASSFSAITIHASTLEAKNAGGGGAGLDGQPGQTGGFGGNPANPSSCPGGQGGAGGKGGASGGGAGGVSAGVLFKGSEPRLDDATKGTIQRGAGGAPGIGPNGNDGRPGESADVIGITGS